MLIYSVQGPFFVTYLQRPFTIMFHPTGPYPSTLIKEGMKPKTKKFGDVIFIPKHLNINVFTV